MIPTPDPLPEPTVPSAAQRLLRAAHELAGIADDLGLPKLARTITSDTERRLRDGRLRVVVLGEVNHGKSSLINALIGRKLVPVGVTPTTSSVVCIRTGDDVGHFHIDEAGQRRSIDREEFERFARGEAARSGGAELVCEAGVLPESIELLDTPGFNDIDQFRAAIARGELPRADVLVLVLDATRVLTRTELELIRDAVGAVGGVRDSGASLELVINRIDLIGEHERETVVDHVRDQLHGLLGERPRPYLTDSRRALAEPDAESETVAGVRRLRARLRELAGVRAQILPARTRTALLRHGQLLGYNAAIQARALTLEESALTQEISAVEAALRDRELDISSLRQAIGNADQAVRARSAERIAHFHDDLRMRALEQVKRADLRTLTEVVPGAIQDAFLEFVRVEAESLRRDLDAMTDDILHTHGELARRRLIEATLHLGFRGPSIYVELPSLKIEAGMILLGLVGTAVMYFGNLMMGMLMTIASPLTTVLLREKSLRDARAQALEAIPGALDKTVRALRDAVGDAIASYVEALGEHVELADEALGEQLVATLLRARQRLAEVVPATSEGARDRHDDLRDAVAGIEARLAALHEDLARLDLGWTPRAEAPATTVVH